MSHIAVLDLLKNDLLSVVRPGRYVGGEFGTTVKKGHLQVALAFADLYEIGMSNQAMQLIYRYLNNTEGVSCERVFAVAEDYEALLKARNLPLYSLETFKPVKEFDILAFTLGYELALTNVFSMLDLARIPHRTTDRREEDPIVIAGGPATVNPLPLGSFFDAVYIGEIEQMGSSMLEELVELKKTGASRAQLLDQLLSDSAMWQPGKKVIRATWSGFGEKQAPLPIVPSIDVAQAHGVVEIMRGCPNGCRFCLAGTYYRPFRCKDIDIILKEVDGLVHQRGLREISLNSLSSADFPQIKELLQALNRRYKNKNISFALPSLRVNAFGLDLLKELSATRKSGLTFAVETPYGRGQMSLNKPVEEEHILDILREAAAQGWKKAKFYFMVGLPLSFGEEEAVAIADYIKNLQRQTNFEFNVNVGIFIPKPHTPYERAAQLTEEESVKRYKLLKEAFGRNKKIKLSFHSTFFAEIEGLLARGDEQAGELAYQAYLRGARFDAWEELSRQDIWRQVLNEAPSLLMEELHRSKSPEEKLPWHEIGFRLSPSYLPAEAEKSNEESITKPCVDYPCTPEAGPDIACGACSPKTHVRKNKFFTDNEVLPAEPEESLFFQRVMFTFIKEGKARYLSHLNLVSVFEKALLRTGYPVRYTQGFNPKPCMDFASPLSLGIESLGEIVSIELRDSGYQEEDFIKVLNNQLPEGLKVTRAYAEEALPEGRRYPSLMALYGGSVYRVTGPDLNGLAERIYAILAEKNAEKEGFLLDCLEDGLYITLKQVNGKIENVVKLLTEALTYNPLTMSSAYQLRREKLFRLKEGELADYYAD